MYFNCGKCLAVKEKLSHIMGPNPILEMARAYGLRPRLWLLGLIIIATATETTPQFFLSTSRPNTF